MSVSIEFLGMQRMATEKNTMAMPVTNGTKVKDAIEYVRQQYPALLLDEKTMVVMVNHKTASLNTVLRDDDTVSFLPMIGGG